MPFDKRYNIGDLVYYNGFEVFEPRKKYIGVKVNQTFEEHYCGEDHYNVFWFDSCLTTHVHYSNILKVYDEKG